MNRSTFRRDLVSLLKENGLFIRKLGWAEDPVKGDLTVTLSAGGMMDEQTAFDFADQEGPGE